MSYAPITYLLSSPMPHLVHLLSEFFFSSFHLEQLLAAHESREFGIIFFLYRRILLTAA